MIEKWVVIESHPHYEVSNMGRVRNMRSGLILKNRKCGRKKEQYAMVLLGNKNLAVHRLVAHHFIGPRPAGYQVNHIDSDKMNPRLDNLEYVTPAQNSQHGYDHGLHRPLLGEKNPAAKINAATVIEIRKLYPSMTQTALGQKYGVSQTTIWSILRGRTWKEAANANGN